MKKYAEYTAQFAGKSKTEALALAQELGYTVRFYQETTHKIPSWLALRADDGRLVDLFFDKTTRRVVIR